MNLYWLTTSDHDEDWFVVANGPEKAAVFFEEVEGYEYGDANAELIMAIPNGVEVDTGWPTDAVLKSCGAEIVLDGLARVVRIGDRTFSEGLMEHTIRSADDDAFEAIGEGRPNKTDRETEH